RFPCAWGAAGETCRETLLRKASEPAAHVAGFGFHLEGFGPPNLPQGVFRRSKSEPAARFRYHVPPVRFAHRNMMSPSLQGCSVSLAAKNHRQGFVDSLRRPAPLHGANASLRAA